MKGWVILYGKFNRLFCCRNQDGRFDEILFTGAQLPQVKMIEIKLSQAQNLDMVECFRAKVSEIVKTCNVPVHKDVISPHKHSEFSTPGELLKFADRLRKLSSAGRY